MKRKIILSLLSLFILFSTGTVIATLYITNTTTRLRQLISLHQIEDFRQNLIMNVQTVQSDLFTFDTSLKPRPSSIGSNMSALEGTVQRCLSCHHTPAMTNRLQNLHTLVKDYQSSLSAYMTAAEADRKDRMKLEAAAIGNKLLSEAEGMSIQSIKHLSIVTGSAMEKINHVKAILYITILFTFILGSMIAARLVFYITRPAEALVKATRAIAAGDLEHTITYKDDTEFGELANAFNSMSKSLKTGYEILRREIAERKQTEQAHAKSEKFLNTIFDSIYDPFCIIDRDYNIVRANESYAKLNGTALEGLIGRKCFEVTENRTTACDECIAEKTYRSSHPCATNRLFTRPGDQKVWTEIYTYPIFGDEGTVTHVIMYTRDITERKIAENSLKESKERYELAADGANDGLWDWDLKADTIYFSPRWKSMLGYRKEQIGNDPEEWFKLIHPDDIAQMKAQISAHINGLTPHLESEYRILHSDNNYRWVLSRGLAVRDKYGNAYRMAGSQTDITSRKAFEEQLLHDAFHDALTGLPNRALFMDRLAHVIRSSKRRRINFYAVLFLDLDRFKVINDSLGHMSGDLLLIEVSGRLIQCLRPGDTVARLGGDEFALLLEDIKDTGELGNIADRIQRALAEPFTIKSQQVFSTASIGIAIGPKNYEKPEHVLRDADIAMYQAKARGKARHAIFDSTMYESTIHRLQIETDLRQAAERKEFFIHYQPVIDLQENTVVGFEALLRWQHPTRGVVPPNEFIPLAEETGLILPIGEWVLREACSQACAWQKHYTMTTPLKISVNISSKQLSQRDFVKRVSGILDETGLDASCLALEITESLIMENPEASGVIMTQLRNLGIHIHIDDFGTGYSSLSYIHRIPVNALKIDRSFVNKMFSNDENMEIIKAIISLAHNLNLYLIAEGLELTDQLTHLKKLKCHYGQGYLFSRPMAVKDIEQWLASGDPLFVLS
jgi:diguanylate cyclase (GGDEF)-like protein/PAS domain S-box-containing protein